MICKLFSLTETMLLSGPQWRSIAIAGKIRSYKPDGELDVVLLHKLRDKLVRVHAPTLLIVEGHDFGVIELNEETYRKLRCEKELSIVPVATHLFEEPGTLEKVAALAAQWFIRHLQ